MLMLIFENGKEGITIALEPRAQKNIRHDQFFEGIGALARGITQ